MLSPEAEDTGNFREQMRQLEGTRADHTGCTVQVAGKAAVLDIDPAAHSSSAAEVGRKDPVESRTRLFQVQLWHPDRMQRAAKQVKNRSQKDCASAALGWHMSPVCLRDRKWTLHGAVTLHRLGVEGKLAQREIGISKVVEIGNVEEVEEVRRALGILASGEHPRTKECSVKAEMAQIHLHDSEVEKRN